MRTAIIFLLFTLMLTGCSGEVTYSEKSGTESDDYIEEPLTETASIYSEALETSNHFLDLVIAGESGLAHKLYINDGLKSVLEADDIKRLFYPDNPDFTGNIKSYKRYQWSFFIEQRSSGDRLHSVKIVEHDKRMKKYDFVFEVNKGFKSIVGFYGSLKKDVSPPGEF